MAIPENDPVPEEATPGELLAVTHAMLMAWALSELLDDAGSSADELIVAAGCTFVGPVPKRRLASVELHVRGRVAGVDRKTFEKAVAEAHRRYLLSCGMRADVPATVRADLQPH